MPQQQQSHIHIMQSAKDKLDKKKASTEKAGQDPIWERIKAEAVAASESEPALSSFIYNIVLMHGSLEIALAHMLATRLGNEAFPSITMLDIIQDAMLSEPSIGECARADILAIVDRDPAVTEYLTPFLYQKGFHAIQGYRVGHWLCQNSRFQTALYLQSRMSAIFSVDIHPMAKIGKGIMIDHAHSIVIGETAVVGDNVSMLHSVTLGGTGKDKGDRHPKVGNNVLIGAGAKILGNIKIGDNSRVGAGSVVLKSVPSGCTVVGVPAKTVKCDDDQDDCPCLSMNQIVPQP